MSTKARSFSQHLIKNLTLIKQADVPLGVVLRNTAAVIVPIGIGIASEHTVIGLSVGAGALQTMFSDQPGPYRQRFIRLILAALAAGLASLCGFLLGHLLLPMLLITLLAGFFGGLLVIFGPDMTRVGMTSMILLVVTAAKPIASPSLALTAAMLTTSGGLILALLSVASWPMHRYLPERKALANVYHGLSELACQHSQDASAAPALTEAMTSLQQTLLGRHHARGRAMEAFSVLLELAERIRLELVAMAEIDEIQDSNQSLRQQISLILQDVATALDTGAITPKAQRTLKILRLEQFQANQIQGIHGTLAPHIQVLTAQLAAVMRNTQWVGGTGERRAAVAEARLPSALRDSSAWATLRANLNMQSIALRHAMRCAACFSLALLVSRLWDLPQGYYLPMSTIIVLRPDFSATFSFGLLRVAGTLLGLLVSTVMLLLTPEEPWLRLTLIALMVMGFRYLSSMNYGIAVAMLSGIVVLMLSFKGIDPDRSMIDPLINTALGTGMALLIYMFWPVWERDRSHTAMANMLDAYASYLAALAQPNQRDAQHEARTLARATRTNAQASLARVRAEPNSTDLLDLINALLSNGNRLIRTAMALEASFHHDDLPRIKDICHFVAQAAIALDNVADALRTHQIPDLPDLRTMQHVLTKKLMQTGGSEASKMIRLSDRLTNNVNTLAHIASRAPQVLVRGAER